MRIFRKRVFTIGTFISESINLFKNFEKLKIAFKRNLVDSSFRERIMLVVTQVNRCRFCSFGHTQAALSTGISAAEIQEILDANFTNVPDHQKLALCFAQRFAEDNGMPEDEALKRLHDYYGAESTLDILSFIRMMAYCNLCGNTIEAFLQRFRGTHIEGSTIVQEFVTILLMITLLPLLLLIGLLFR